MAAIPAFLKERHGREASSLKKIHWEIHGSLSPARVKGQRFIFHVKITPVMNQMKAPISSSRYPKDWWLQDLVYYKMFPQKIINQLITGKQIIRSAIIASSSMWVNTKLSNAFTQLSMGIKCRWNIMYWKKMFQKPSIFSICLNNPATSRKNISANIPG